MRGNSGSRRPENSAATASIAGCAGVFGAAENPSFIGFLTLARRLLIFSAVKLQGRPVRRSSEILSMVLAALGAASSALEPCKSLTSSKSPLREATGLAKCVQPVRSFRWCCGFGKSDPSSTSGGFSRLSPSTMNALLAAQSQSTTTTSAPTSPSSALQDLFSQLDTNGDGQISKAEFKSALGAGGTNVAQADDVFSKLDKNGDGSVSLDELSSALRDRARGPPRSRPCRRFSRIRRLGQRRRRRASTDPLLQALSGASSTTVNNSDGRPRPRCYADGSEVAMTSPAGDQHIAPARRRPTI